MSVFQRVKDWRVKISLIISLLMGIATLTIGSHGVSKINNDPNTKMLDRSKYLATFIYEIVTGCLKIIDPLLGLAYLCTKKMICFKLSRGLKAVLICTQLVGTTYLYTIRLDFELLTNTRYEACYYKFGSDTECTEAWQSLQNTSPECANATNNTMSSLPRRYFYILQKQQQTHLWQLMESLPALVSNNDQIIANTAIDGTTTNVLDWWNSMANTAQEIYDEYLKNISVVTTSELDKLIRLLPKNLQNIWSAIHNTTITVQGPTTTATSITNMASDAKILTNRPSSTAQTLIERTSWNEEWSSSASQYSALITTSIPTTDLQSSFTTSQASLILLENPISNDDVNIWTAPDLHISMVSTVITDLTEDYGATVVNSATTTSQTDTYLSFSSDISDSTLKTFTEVTETSSIESSLVTNTSPFFVEPYSTEHTVAFLKILPEFVRQQPSIQYTTNVHQWWNPFKQLLINIEKEYQKMIALRLLPPPPPQECKQDIYHMKYIATHLTVSVAVYSLNMITDIASFVSIYKLSRLLMASENEKYTQRF